MNDQTPMEQRMARLNDGSSLFFDTETTGFYHSKKAPDHPAQPHMVQIGMQLVDKDLNIQAEFSTLIKPDGWVVPTKTAEFHGITTERCEAFGIPLASAMHIFQKYLDIADQYVCHNQGFDKNIIAQSAHVVGARNPLIRKPYFCTMLQLIDIVKAPYPSGKAGHKWPSLQEAHIHYFGQGFDGAHDAMEDIRATVNVYRGIRDNNPELIRG